MSSLKKKKRLSRRILNEKEKGILVGFWERGMRYENSILIQDAAKEVGMPERKVKVWIRNHRASKKHPAKKEKLSLRPLNGYNLFCKTLKDKGIDFKKWGQTWKELDDASKENYKKQAQTRTAQKESVTPQQLNRMKNIYINQIMKSCSNLQSIGVEVGGLSLHNGHTSNKQTTKDLIQQVRQIFNGKYSEAVLKPAKMPYSKAAEELTVTGLPNGVTLKNPSCYGPHTLQRIIEEKENICVLINRCPEKKDEAMDTIIVVNVEENNEDDSEEFLQRMNDAMNM